MGLGSVIGAVIGGLLVGSVPAAVLKTGLGVILIVSAWRTFRRHGVSTTPTRLSNAPGDRFAFPFR